ncbi:hypothetical protein [Actinoplanes sp. NPDC023714]|uniref:hypothetical protein n=1 Tax=Actinoplanes sp. NPDC023714 TaxID=3154322 RepID=UPI0033DDC4DF
MEMNWRALLILAASAATGAALGIFTSAQDGFFGALGVGTLLHALLEPKADYASKTGTELNPATGSGEALLTRAPEMGPESSGPNSIS